MLFLCKKSNNLFNQSSNHILLVWNYKQVFKSAKNNEYPIYFIIMSCFSIHIKVCWLSLFLNFWLSHFVIYKFEAILFCLTQIFTFKWTTLFFNDLLTITQFYYYFYCIYCNWFLQTSEFFEQIFQFILIIWFFFFGWTIDFLASIVILVFLWFSYNHLIIWSLYFILIIFFGFFMI